MESTVPVCACLLSVYVNGDLARKRTVAPLYLNIDAHEDLAENGRHLRSSRRAVPRPLRACACCFLPRSRAALLQKLRSLSVTVKIRRGKKTLRMRSRWPFDNPGLKRNHA